MMKPDKLRLSRGPFGALDDKKTSRRFPKDGILAYPAEMTDISKTMHRRRQSASQADKATSGRRPYSDSKVESKELQKGLSRLGVTLSAGQIDKLRDMSGDSVLCSIMQLSDRVSCSKGAAEKTSAKEEPTTALKAAGKCFGHAAPVDQASRSATRNLRNNSNQLIDLLEEKRTHGPEKKRATEHTHNNNASRNVKDLMNDDVATHAVRAAKQDILRSQDGRATNADQKKALYSGRNVRMLLRDAERAREAPSQRNRLKNVRNARPSPALRRLKVQLLERFGQDLSQLEDLVAASDMEATGYLSFETFDKILERHAGVHVTNQDAESVHQALVSPSQEQVAYREFFAGLAAEAKRVLPDHTVRPVNLAQKRGLLLHRLVGQPLAKEYGSAKNAFEALAVDQNGKSTDARALVSKLEESGVVSLGAQDKRRILLEFQKVGRLNRVDLASFEKVLVGAAERVVEKKNKRVTSTESRCEQQKSWHSESKDDSSEESKSISMVEKRPEPEMLLCRVRDFVETKRSWGVGVRDVFLLLDKERSGRLASRQAVDRLVAMGLDLSPRESSRLAELIGTKPGQASSACTYSSFASALNVTKQLDRDTSNSGSGQVQALNNAQQPPLVHNLVEKRHVAGRNPAALGGGGGELCDSKMQASPASTCTVEHALEQLCLRGKSTADAYFGAKKSNACLNADTLHASLEIASGLKIHHCEFRRALRQANIAAKTMDIKFSDFLRLLDAEGRSRLTSSGCEMAKKAPSKLAFEQQRATSQLPIGFESPKALSDLRGDRAKGLLFPQQQSKPNPVKHKSRPATSQPTSQATKILRFKMSPPLPPKSGGVPLEL